jgi:predicted nucleic acid-binding protein
MVVAAIAEVNDCVIVTDNEKHFSGTNLLNPLHPGRRKGTRLLP